VNSQRSAFLGHTVAMVMMVVVKHTGAPVGLNLEAWVAGTLKRTVVVVAKVMTVAIVDCTFVDICHKAKQTIAPLNEVFRPVFAFFSLILGLE
jgi:hypothetical protein